jgi:hypothetical protein
MKIIYNIFIISSTLIVFLFTGCTKVLDTTPELFVDNNAAIVDKRSANAALIGAYNSLSSNSNQGNTFRYIANLSSDNLRWVGNSPINREFWVHEVFATNTRVLELWRALYATINVANNIIEKVPLVNDVTYSDAERKRDRGEAFFLRAHNHFDLTRLWGNIPLALKATEGPNDAKGVGNKPQAEVYRQIELDLDSAISLLPASGSINRNRANIYAAKALKARLHLYRQEWAQANTLATEIIAQESLFRLVKPYNQFYLTKNTTESVFEIAFTINNRNSWATNWFASNITGGTRELLPTNGLIALLQNPNSGGDRSGLLLPIGNIIYGNMNFKIATGDDPVYAIRIAELFLIRAEARAHLNNLAGGLQDLNAIRVRSNVPAIESVANATELISKVLDERRVEFAYESHRWFDMIRTGKAKEAFKITDAFRLRLPIPTQELLINDALVQNEGY